MWFGNKTKIVELENRAKSQGDTIRRLAANELAAQRKLREMDQLVFAMSQCTSWDQMQPIFLKLKTFTDARMIDESNRIKNVLIPEMQKAYREPPLPEQDEETRSKLPTGKWISGGNC